MDVWYQMAVDKVFGLDTMNTRGITDAVQAISRAVSYNSPEMLMQAKNQMETARRQEESRQRALTQYNRTISGYKNGYGAKLKQAQEEKLLNKPYATSFKGAVI